METLAEKLKKIIEKSGMTHANFSNRHGISKTTISAAINGRDVSNSAIKLMVDEFGDDFIQYYKSTFCEICGKEFISLNGRTKFCSIDCQKEKIKRSKQRWVDQRSYINCDFNNITEPVKTRHVIPKKTIGEFMDGKSYAERQREYLLGIQKTQRMEIR